MAHTSKCDGKTRGLGRTLVIANPVAHSGQGEGATQFVVRFLSAYKSATSGYRIARTGASGDATGIAADASDFDTVIALGGDGVIHEVAEGLMAIDPGARPRLGIIPMGTGNDYARTLGMARNDPEEALRQLVGGREKSIEVGRVNGRYFVETLSFGLDAAIALDTTNKRANETNQEGTELFVRSAIRIFSRAGKGFPCTVSFDGADPIESRSIIFAFQVGPTYGAGFKVCPDADPADGLLDVCRNTVTPPLPVVMGLLGAARFGSHTHSRIIEMRRVRHAVLDFESEPPCQVDGEGITGTHFEVDVIPKALRVVVPA